MASSVENGSDLSPQRRLKKRAPSLSDLTPRDKAKFYEEKRRREVKQQKELKAEQEKKKREKWESTERLKEHQAKTNSPSPSPSSLPVPEFNFKSIDHELLEREERARQRDEEDRLKREEDERREKRQMEDIFQRKKELERRQEEEKNQKYKMEMERENLARREREERERADKEREKREKEERERKEREQRERREQEERERRDKEKAEQDRRLQLERERLDNDPSLQEERRKKDELLRKLQEMDKIGNNKPIPDPFAGHKSKENSSGYDTPGKRSDPKEYSFTKPVNNLHRGKPSHEDVSVPYIQRNRQKALKDDDEIGGYQPSFGPTRGAKTTTTKPLSLFDDDPAPLIKTTTKTENKSSNLLENLFGPQVKTGQPAERKKSEETFFITNNSSPVNSKRTTNNSSSAFPWEMSPSPNKNSNFQSNFSNDNKGNSTLFGGGAALIEDDLTPNSNRTLLHRPRQQNVNTFSSKPTVSAVDTFDDEIEEVVL